MGRDQRRSVVYSQNFVKHAGLARRIVDLAAIEQEDLVLEFGPGKGVLTRELAKRCRAVVAIEKDSILAARLSHHPAATENVVIFAADLLDLPLPLTRYKVVANIPFNITAQIIAKLSEADNPPEEAWLIMQREAAKRFLGEPRTTLVSVSIRPWFELSIAHWFRRTDFVPPPRVEVILLRFSKRGPPLVRDEERQLFRDFVTYGFTAWQRTVRDAYRELLSDSKLSAAIERARLDLERKPSAIPFEQWLTLYGCFAEHTTGHQRRIVEGAEARLRRQQERLTKQHRTRSHS
jgi:23S rRNA (adenine-N6)-dimethyltransferase